MATVKIAGAGGATMTGGTNLNRPKPALGGAKTVPTGPKAVETSKTPKRKLVAKGKGAGKVAAYNRGAALRDKIKAKYGSK